MYHNPNKGQMKSIRSSQSWVLASRGNTIRCWWWAGCELICQQPLAVPSKPQWNQSLAESDHYKTVWQSRPGRLPPPPTPPPIAKRSTGTSVPTPAQYLFTWIFHTFSAANHWTMRKKTGGVWNGWCVSKRLFKPLLHRDLHLHYKTSSYHDTVLIFFFFHTKNKLNMSFFSNWSWTSTVFVLPNSWASSKGPEMFIHEFLLA